MSSAPKRGPLARKAFAIGNRAGVKLIPHLPGGIKRLAAGGRAVTIDGNTLDPSLQMSTRPSCSRPGLWWMCDGWAR